MSYQIKNQTIPKEKREDYNKRILKAIDKNKGEIPRETIFNCYTGLGGLHGLKQANFGNYNDYSQAKKEFEMGQFFTPHDLCRQIVEIAAPEATESILDMCCGMGNFFNYLPNPYNAYGFDIDPNAVKVAKYLYPDANIQTQDIRCFDPISASILSLETRLTTSILTGSRRSFTSVKSIQRTQSCRNIHSRRAHDLYEK